MSDGLLVLRTVRFAPYRKGAGPTFTLVMRDSGRVDNRGQTYVAYTLSMRDPGARKSLVLFDAADFSGSPMHADDSDASVMALMSFLTLRPGDTDAEYFADYTEEQLWFADTHAEALSCEVDNRFASSTRGAV